MFNKSSGKQTQAIHLVNKIGTDISWKYITVEVNGVPVTFFSTVFSHLDLSDAFLQIVVDEDSRKLLSVSIRTKESTSSIDYHEDLKLHLQDFNKSWMQC